MGEPKGGASFDNPIYKESQGFTEGSSVKMGSASGTSCSRNRLLLCGLAVLSAIAATALVTYYASHKDCPAVQPTATSTAAHVGMTTTSPASSSAITTTSPASSSGAMTTSRPSNWWLGMMSSPDRSTCTQDNECPENNIVRIPRHVLPSHYHIEMKPDIYNKDPKDFSFWAKVTIDMKCQQPTAFIQLNYRKFTIKDDTVKVTSKGQEIKVVTTWSNQTLDQELYIIHVERTLMVDEEIQVSMEYEGAIDKYSGRGYFYSDYKVNGQWKYMLATQLESTWTREFFPCMDDPGLKATFAVSIWRKTPCITLNNMPQEGSSEDKGNGWLVDHYQTTPRMSAYLVAIIVGEYSSVDAPSSHGHNVKIWAPVEYIEAGWASYSASIAGVALDVYDDLFNFKYPLPKLDVACVPDKGGAMENWGLIHSSMPSSMHDPTINGEVLKGRLSSVMFHEEVHLWFGDLVTCEWWSDIWLNEAFATYYHLNPWKETNPQWEMQTYDQGQMTRDMYYEETGDKHAAHNPGVDTLAEISGMFSGVTYGRTRFVLNMMRNLVMSPEEWDTAMSYYLTDNAYGAATYRELYGALDKFVASHQTKYEMNPSEVLDTWIRQMGHPVVTVTTLPPTNHVYATQKLFTTFPDSPIVDNENPSPFGYKWHVPMPYVTSFAPTEERMVWLKRSDVDFDLDYNLTTGSWILANHKYLGFYRVNYDSENWHALIQQMWDDHTVIPPENRAALITDAFVLARAGELDFSIPLKLTTYLSMEKDFLPWAALRWVNYNFMEFYMKLLDSNGAYREYMRELITPIYEDLGWTAKTSEKENFINMYLRMYITELACRFGNEHCLAHSLQTVQNYMNDASNHKIVDPDAQLEIFCSAVQFDPTNSTWLFVYGRWVEWQDEDIQHERLPYLLEATTCTRDPTLLQWMFDAAMDKSSSMPDAGRTTILQGIARNPVGMHIVVKYIWNSWNDDHEYREILLQASSETVHSHEDLHMIEKWMEDQRIDVLNPSLYHRITSQIERNIRFAEDFESTIDTFLFNKTAKYHYRMSADGALLPRNLYPTHYDVMLLPDIYHDSHVDFQSWGGVTISLTAVNRTDVLYLHYQYIKINFTAIMVDTVSNDLDLHVVRVVERPEHNCFAIYFDREVGSWENITVAMLFTDIIRSNTTKAGLYWNLYHDKDLKPKYMLGTQLQATRAEWVFPCIDECGIKSHFTIRMARKTNYHSQSNMPIKQSVEVASDTWYSMFLEMCGLSSDNWYIDEFETTNVPMQTYLLSFAVSDFTSELCKEAKYNHSIWAQRKYVEAGFTNYAANISAKIQNYFEELFNVSFPLPKQDEIVISDRTGAMETWGLLTFADYYLLYDPELSDIYDLVQVARVGGHELAHMWFGDLVTAKYLDDIFLQESYASFYENVAVQYVEPGIDMDQMFYRTRYLAAFASDSTGTSMPIRKGNLEIPSDPTYGVILYYKGASVLRMVEALVLKQYWQEIHQNYLRSYALGNANLEDYLGVFDEIDMKYNISGEIGVSPSLLMRNWLTQAGYPVINFYYMSGSNRIRVTQKRFLLNPDKPTVEWYPNSFGYRWEVPLTFETQNGANSQQHSVVMHQRDVIYDISGPVDCIIANYESKGFYRTNYETSNWLAIIGVLNSSHTAIDVKVRAKLVDDALNLARAGEMDQVLALQLLEYLAAEVEFAPWYAYIYSGDFLLEMLPSFTSWPTYQAHMRHLLATAYTNLGWTVSESDSATRRMARMYVMPLACHFNVMDCRAKASQQLASWKAAPDSLAVIHPELREAVFCTAMADSSNASRDWDFLFDRYLHFRAIDHFSRARAELRAALACTTEKYILQRYFQMAIDGDARLDSRDRYAAAASVAENPVARADVWEYLDTNWDTMPWKEQILAVLADYLNTEAEYVWLQEFYAKHHVSEITQTDLNYEVRANIKWRITNEEAIGDWLSTVATA